MRASTARYPYIPIVSYRVAPRGEQRTGTTGNRGLIWNISGSVPSAAALAVGLLAFSGSSDAPPAVPAERIPEQVRGDRLINAWLASVPQVAVPAATPSVVATPRGNGLPGIATAPPVRPGDTDRLTAVAERVTQELGPVGKPVLELSAEAIEPQPALAPEPAPFMQRISTGESEIVRRDYSKTLRIAASSPQDNGAATVVPGGAPVDRVAAIRDRLRSLKSRTGPGEGAAPGEVLSQPTDTDLASNGQAMVHGPVSGNDVTLRDGKLAAVKLGALLTLVEAKMERAEYEALSQSSNAQVLVTPALIEGIGMQASFDADKSEIALSSID